MRFLLIFFLLSGIIALNAQQKDSLIYLKQDKLNNKNILPDSATNQYQKLNLRKLVVPSALITYGFVARGSDALKKIDTSIKKNVTAKNFHTTIDNYLDWAPGMAVYALNALGIKGKHNFRDRTITYLLSNIIVAITVQSLKKITKELRPDGSDYNSFPSGHTAVAFAGAAFLNQEYKHLSTWYGFAGYTVATATGILRIYNNEHWFRDVIAGAGVGILSTKMAYWLEPKIATLLFKKRSSSSFNPVNY